MPREIDSTFVALPMRALAEAALQRCVDLGVQYAAFRFERIRTHDLSIHDTTVASDVEAEDLGWSVRVLHDGSWGFASSTELSAAGAVRAADEAVAVARACRPLSPVRVELADEPVHADVTWTGAVGIDPFAVPRPDQVALLTQRCRDVLGGAGVQHARAAVRQAHEAKFYADTAGTVTTQLRTRVGARVTALAVDRDGRPVTVRTLAPPAARGWEYVTGDDGAVDWAAELAALGPALAEKAAAPVVAPGHYDLVVDPTNLWLAIHRSIGHPTELDRVLGHERVTTGSSFAGLDQLWTLRYGSPIMHVTADRTTAHALATIGFDDEGVRSQAWDIVREGVLVGNQRDRSTTQANLSALGTSRSNGCAYAAGPGHAPLPRMANVSLRPAEAGPSTEELISQLDEGLYVVGDDWAWSDPAWARLQVGGQRCYRIRRGRLAGQVRHAAYASTATDFWHSLAVLGGPQTYRVGGSLGCARGHPRQAAPASHGAPAALFSDVPVVAVAGPTP